MFLLKAIPSPLDPADDMMDTSNNSPASPGRDGPEELIAPDGSANVQLDVQVHI